MKTTRWQKQHKIVKWKEKLRKTTNQHFFTNIKINDLNAFSDFTLHTFIHSFDNFAFNFHLLLFCLILYYFHFTILSCFCPLVVFILLGLEKACRVQFSAFSLVDGFNGIPCENGIKRKICERIWLVFSFQLNAGCLNILTLQ